MVAQSSSSQQPEIPADLWAVMAEIGPRWATNVSGHVQMMIERFSAVLESAPPAGTIVRRDILYGAHARQAIDVYLPKTPDTKRPVVIFVHGGAFLDGHRNRSNYIYGNVLQYFARHGIVGVNIGYRLAGDATYPGASLDVAAAVKWVRDHADEIGVDCGKVFLMGHSAGCAHVGSYAYDKSIHGPDGHGLQGLIVVSGRVRAEVSPDNPNARKVEAYYGTTDAARLDAVSPVSHIAADSVATFVAWAEYENPLIDVHCAELVYRLGQAKRRTPPTMWLKAHNHTSSIAHFNTAEDALGRAILEFINDPV